MNLPPVNNVPIRKRTAALLRQDVANIIGKDGEYGEWMQAMDDASGHPLQDECFNERVGSGNERATEGGLCIAWMVLHLGCVRTCRLCRS